MNLNLRRTTKTAAACLGELEVDGSFECYTLEDPDGAGDRIDAGTYNVITDFSNRFQKIMPLLTGPKVDGRGIRIHSGNTQADTEGCILLGTEHGANEVENSRVAFQAFYTKLETALARGEVVTLTVSDEIQPKDSGKDAQSHTLPTVAGTYQTAVPAPALPLGNVLSPILDMLKTLLSLLKPS